MLTDDQTQHLILSIEARTDKLDAALAGMVTNSDQHFRSLEAAAQNSTKRIEGYMEKAGRSVATKFLSAMGTVLTVRAIGGFVENVVDQAKSIREQSAALDVSTDAFQAWSLMARKAGLDQEQFNSGLDHLIKNFEEAKIKAGPVAVALKNLIPDWRKLSPEQFIFSLADAIKKTDADLRAGVLGSILGGTGGGSSVGTILVPFFSQGAASMQSQAAQSKAQGEIIPPQTFEKLQKLDDAWIDLKAQFSTAGATAITSFADNLDRIEGGISSEKFQSSMKQFGQILAGIAANAPTIAHYLLPLMGAQMGAVFGPWGALVGGMVGLMGPGIYLRNFASDIVKAQAKVSDLETELGALKDHLKNSSGWEGFGATKGIERDIESVTTKLRNAKAYLLALQLQSDASAKIGGTQDAAGGTKGGAGDKPPDPTAGTLAYDRAVQSIKAKIEAMKTGTDTVADYTAAEQAATEKAALLAAAESDAAKKGLDANAYVAARSGEIDRLASQYGALRAQQAWDGDLASEDARIAKLKAQAEAAGATVRATAEMVELETLLAKFHNEYGLDANPTPEQHMAMYQRAQAAGQGAAGDSFGKAVDSAQKQIDAMSKDNATVGLFGGALATAQMRMELLNAAMEAGIPIDKETQATIDALAKQYGALSQQHIDLAKNYQDEVQITDELRSGLENTFMAGEKGFKSMGTAAKQFLLQLVELAVKIELLDPLLTKLFGPQGTAGGGSLGSALNWLMGGSSGSGAASGIGNVAKGAMNGIASSGGGWLENAFQWVGNLFADGGVMTRRGRVPLRTYSGGGIANSPQLAMFGEGSGPEAFVPLKNGGIPVHMKMPTIGKIPRGSLSSTTNVHMPINVDARGAQAGVAEQIKKRLGEVVPQIVQQAVGASDARFHDNLHRTIRDRW